MIRPHFSRLSLEWGRPPRSYTPSLILHSLRNSKITITFEFQMIRTPKNYKFTRVKSISKVSRTSTSILTYVFVHYLKLT